MAYICHVEIIFIGLNLLFELYNRSAFFSIPRTLENHSFQCRSSFPHLINNQFHDHGNTIAKECSVFNENENKQHSQEQRICINYM